MTKSASEHLNPVQRDMFQMLGTRPSRRSHTDGGGKSGDFLGADQPGRVAAVADDPAACVEVRQELVCRPTSEGVGLNTSLTTDARSS
jgi:hypothetical protein